MPTHQWRDGFGKIASTIRNGLTAVKVGTLGGGEGVEGDGLF